MNAFSLSQFLPARAFKSREKLLKKSRKDILKKIYPKTTKNFKHQSQLLAMSRLIWRISNSLMYIILQLFYFSIDLMKWNTNKRRKFISFHFIFLFQCRMIKFCLCRGGIPYYLQIPILYLMDGYFLLLVICIVFFN